jgi:hypothetical protein
VEPSFLLALRNEGPQPSNVRVPLITARTGKSRTPLDSAIGAVRALAHTTHGPEITYSNILPFDRKANNISPHLVEIVYRGNGLQQST